MKDFPKSFKKGTNGNIEYKKGWQIERSSDNPMALHQLFSKDKIYGVIGPSGNMGFSESLEDFIFDDQDELEDNWTDAVLKYEKLFSELSDDILNTDVFISELIKFKGFGTTGVNKNGELQVKISPLVNQLNDDDYWNVILHEMCHVAAFYKDGSLDHGDTWHYYVDKLNKIGYNISEFGDDIVSKLEESTNEPEMFYVISGPGSNSFCGPNNNEVREYRKALKFKTVDEAKEHIQKLMARKPIDFNPFTQSDDECIGGTFMHNEDLGNGKSIIWKPKHFSIIPVTRDWERQWQNGSFEQARRFNAPTILRAILNNGTTGTTLYRGIDENDKVYTSLMNAIKNGESECEVDLRVTSTTSDQKVLSNTEWDTRRDYAAVVVFDKDTLAYKMNKTKSQFSYQKEYLTFGKFKLTLLKKDYFIIPNGKYTTYEKWDKRYWEHVKLIRATPIDQSVEQAKALMRKHIDKRRAWTKAEPEKVKDWESYFKNTQYFKAGQPISLEETKGWFSVEANFKDKEEAQLFKDKLDSKGIYTTANFRLSSSQIEDIYKNIYNKMNGKTSSLFESDYRFIAKAGDKWLNGNSLTDKKEDAEAFESETEPTQRINQLKKDGKINKNLKISISKVRDN